MLLAWADADSITTADERVELSISPGVVKLARRRAFRPAPGKNWEAKAPVPASTRGQVVAWSDRSRRRMVEAIASMPWEGGGWALATLTYPGDWLACVPSQREAKRHLRALRERWARKWGSVEAFWKLEFQGRGAPHYHLLVRLPHGVDLRVMRSWLARAWYEIVGSGDERHLRAGTAIDAQWRDEMNPAAVGFYFAKHGTWASKEYQHQPPAAWADGTGRWWGSWNLHPVIEVVDINPAMLVHARRIFRRWYRSRHPRRMVLRACERHGDVVVQRVGYVGGRLKSLQGKNRDGAALLVRDGPAFALALGRAIGLLNQGSEHAKRQLLLR